MLKIESDLTVHTGLNKLALSNNVNLLGVSGHVRLEK